MSVQWQIGLGNTQALNAPGNRGASATQSTLPATSDDHASLPQLGFNLQAARLMHGPAPQPAASGESFDARVRGRQPHSVDMQLARLCKDVRHPDNQGIDGWQRLDDAQLMQAGIDPAALEDPATGFRAAIYQDDDGNHVLAFAGSNDIKDWLDNLRQGAGLPAAEYSQAVVLATQAKAAFGDDLVLTGTSLGGGLASMASLATDTAAVTFNASGLNDRTIERLAPEGRVDTLKQMADNGLVRQYSVEGEILTSLQDATPMPDAVGHRIELEDPAPLESPDIHWYDWLSGKAEYLEAKHAVDKVVHAKDLHMIEAVIQSMDEAPPWGH